MLVEKMISLGSRDAQQRVAHYLLGPGACLMLVGLGSKAGYNFPLTQYPLAEVLGLSAAHINREVRQLREVGLPTFRDDKVIFNDYNGLVTLAKFNVSYLDQEGQVLRQSHCQICEWSICGARACGRAAGGDACDAAPAQCAGASVGRSGERVSGGIKFLDALSVILRGVGLFSGLIMLESRVFLGARGRLVPSSFHSLHLVLSRRILLRCRRRGLCHWIIPSGCIVKLLKPKEKMKCTEGQHFLLWTSRNLATTVDDRKFDRQTQHPTDRSAENLRKLTRTKMLEKRSAGRLVSAEGRSSPHF